MLNIIPVCFSTDNNYFPYMAAAIHSVMENASKQQLYRIFILYADTDIYEEYKLKLENHIKVYDNFAIEYIDVTDYIKGYSFNTSNTTLLPNVTYYRLLIPYIFGRYEKVIYLDCDIICLEDIAKILNDNPMDAVLEASRDLGMLDKKNKEGKEYIEQLGLKNHTDYFNAGVLVFNIAAFAKAITQDELFSKANLSHLRYSDQCILNIVCEGKVRFLNMAWNLMSDKDMKFAHPYDNEYKIARKYPYIIHYIYKPWKHIYISKRHQYFWQHATKTPFFDTKYSEMDYGELHESIYNDIRKGKRFGPRFLIKCSILWIITKIKKCFKFGRFT